MDLNFILIWSAFLLAFYRMENIAVRWGHTRLSKKVRLNYRDNRDKVEENALEK